MPAGLDGNPDPIQTEARSRIVESIAARVLDGGHRRTLVGVDGRSGSGKSTFADELAVTLRHHGRSVIRATTDSFHRPRVERLARGATSAEGYLHDSHQLDRLRGELLDPFRAGADTILTAAFDEPSDACNEIHEVVPSQAVLVFDGLFVLRPEFVSYWHVSILLEADRRCDEAWLDFLLGDLPADPTERADEIDRRLSRARWPRYREGWKLYLETADPASRATFVVDNNAFAAPTVIRWPQ